MDSATASAAAATAVVVVTLLAAGPAVGLIDTPRSDAARLGDGDATVRAVTLEHPPRITHGRFGSGVLYLRIPALDVSLGTVTGSPRVVYAVAVPELGFKRVATERLTGADGKTVAVRMSDRAFRPDRVRNDTYVVRTTVRIQSFTTDRVVQRRNVTAEVIE